MLTAEVILVAVIPEAETPVEVTAEEAETEAAVVTEVESDLDRHQ
jgi:hypothetical protein